jgi:hypothetical protein
MSYQPPYTITSSIVSLVADISERMGYLSALESEARKLPPKSSACWSRWLAICPETNDQGRLKRIGADKGGYWEVLK